MTKRQKERIKNLLPNGTPRWVRVYDNGGESTDRYTVVYSGRYPKTDRRFYYLAMSGLPFHPQGFCQHGETQYRAADLAEWGSWAPAIGRKCHLGKRIAWSDLNEDCQKAAMDTYCDLWDIPNPNKSS